MEKYFTKGTSSFLCCDESKSIISSSDLRLCKYLNSTFRRERERACLWVASLCHTNCNLFNNYFWFDSCREPKLRKPVAEMIWEERIRQHGCVRGHIPAYEQDVYLLTAISKRRDHPRVSDYSVTYLQYPSDLCNATKYVHNSRQLTCLYDRLIKPMFHCQCKPSMQYVHYPDIFQRLRHLYNVA